MLFFFKIVFIFPGISDFGDLTKLTSLLRHRTVQNEDSSFKHFSTVQGTVESTIEKLRKYRMYKVVY